MKPETERKERWILVPVDPRTMLWGDAVIDEDEWLARGEGRSTRQDEAEERQERR